MLKRLTLAEAQQQMVDLPDELTDEDGHLVETLAIAYFLCDSQ
jgi:hypothetical protein